jgi:hypothetical protein
MDALIVIVLGHDDSQKRFDETGRSSAWCAGELGEHRTLIARGEAVSAHAVGYTERSQALAESTRAGKADPREGRISVPARSTCQDAYPGSAGQQCGQQAGLMLAARKQLAEAGEVSASDGSQRLG